MNEMLQVATNALTHAMAGAVIAVIVAEDRHAFQMIREGIDVMLPTRKKLELAGVEHGSVNGSSVAYQFANGSRIALIQRERTAAVSGADDVRATARTWFSKEAHVRAA